MASFEFLAVILTGLGLIVSILYYTTVLQNANKTRQTQLLMNLYETYRSPIFRKQTDDVMHRMEWDNYEDFLTKYAANTNSEERTSWFSVATFYEGLGVLVKRKLIDLSIVEDLLGLSIQRAWERIGPIETRSRKQMNSPRLFNDFEFLYNELMKYYAKHPELEIATPRKP